MLQKLWQPSDRSFAAAREVNLVCAARGVRGFGDGFAMIILPAYLTAIGFDAAAVGIVATAALLGSAAMTLAIGHLAARHDLRPFLIVGAFVMVATGFALPQIEHIAFIAARVPPLSDRMTTHWPATPDILATIRQLLRRWMSRSGATEDEIFDITVATQEACANAIEHAYAPGPAAFEVLLEHDAGQVRITIRDRGRWREPRGENRGRGLPLMRTLMDQVDVRDTAGGTEIVLAKTLGVKV